MVDGKAVAWPSGASSVAPADNWSSPDAPMVDSGTAVRTLAPPRTTRPPWNAPAS
jgi:hypothetical protein